MAKYVIALKTLLPFRCSTPKDKNEIPINHAGFFSYSSVNWMNKLMWKAARKGLTDEDIGTTGEPDGVNANSERLTRIWNRELQINGADISLLTVLWRFNRFRLSVGALCGALNYFLLFITAAWITQGLLEYLENEHSTTWDGVVLIIYMSVATFVKNIGYNLYWIIGNVAATRSQSALQMLLFQKIFRIKTNRGENLLAEVVGYYAVDIERIYHTVVFVGLLFGMMTITFANIAYGYYLIGPWSLLGNSIIVIYYPVLIYMNTLVKKYKIKASDIRDERMNITNNILTHIKSIKMHAWEEVFSTVINALRKKEGQQLQKACCVQSNCYTTSIIFPILAPTASIIGYILTGGKLTTPLIFTYMCINSVYMGTLLSSQNGVKALSEGIISCNRIQKLLLAPEGNHKKKINAKMGDDKAIQITDVVMTWADLNGNMVNQEGLKNEKTKRSIITPEFKHSDTTTKELSNLENNLTLATSSNNSKEGIKVTLNNIQLTVKKGELIGICGSVGCGKSSLLSLITEQGTIIKGSVSVKGYTALATQSAWIFTGNIRDNIIFGLPYDKDWYKQVVHACCLEKDFSLMPHGDKTEIGERGANLSGGQKQRINLARAVYSKRDIYLLDDVLSAVDVKVAKVMFRNCIKGILRGKTILLATHSTDQLQKCDRILLMKDGEIIQQGTYQELTSTEEGSYANTILAKTFQRRQKERVAVRKSSLYIEEDEINELDVDHKMIKDEIDANKKLTLKTFLYFCKKCGGYTICFLTLFVVFIFNCAILFHSFWMRTWLNEKVYIKTALYTREYKISDTKIVNETYTIKLIIWVSPAILMTLIGALRGYLTAKVLIKGATNMHNTMFWKIVGCPMSFFIVTPVGRLLNRFSRDMDELDVHIPFTGEYVIQSLMMTLLQLILILAIFPWYFLAMGPLIIIMLLVDALFNGSVREFKRLANLRNPHVLVHVANTLRGLPVIKCFKKENMFSESFKKILDHNSAANLLYQLSTKWIAFRIETISWVMVTAVTITIVFTKGLVSPSDAGLALLQLIWISNVFAVTIRWKADLVARVISIERITDYCMNAPKELAAIIKDNRSPQGWPRKGTVDFINVYLRYQPNLPYALNGVSVHIKDGEKVGIIGRTGAGKSSIIEALLRLTEINDGSIVIDEIDISKLGLHDLRSKLAVVPQDPVLFDGTVRWNLDPFNEYNDEDIWDALDKVHLKSKIENEPLMLDTHLTSETDMFSLGEKQLFCLARALIKKSKILILDEAMASVDSETDQFVQNLLRQSFSHCTILAVAHRLHTISDYDKIMTMDAGKIIEFDTPQSLLTKQSVFRSMMTTAMENV